MTTDDSRGDLMSAMLGAMVRGHVSLCLAQRWIHGSRKVWRNTTCDGAMRYLLWRCGHPSLRKTEFTDDGGAIHPPESYCRSGCIGTFCPLCASLLRKISPDPPTIDDIMRAMASK